MKFYIVTQGCKINQYESHALHEAFERAGFCSSVTPEQADFIFVHSCAITAKAVADLRNILRKLARIAPQSKIILGGCAVKVQEELGTLEGVHATLTKSEKTELVLNPLQKIQQVLGSLGSQNLHYSSAPCLSSAPPCTSPADPCLSSAPPCTSPADPCTSSAESVPFSLFPPFSINTYGRSRALVKIQDGCSHGCTYCIVPLTRGVSCSRPVQDSLAEIERLLDAGYREIGINGVNLRQYGRDFASPHDFWDFMRLVEERFAPDWAGKIRFRISSLEPLQLNEKALECLGTSVLIAPHLHISLQSGSKSVLRRMGRGHYNPDNIVHFIDKLHKFWPIFGLGADIITGFPEETDAEFADTLDLCQELPFSYAHIFPYSRRPKTVANSMQGQILQRIKKERAAVLRDCIATKKQKFLHKLLVVPQVFVAVEQSEKKSAKDVEQAGWQGVNEYYVNCQCAGAPNQSTQHELVTAQPIDVVNENLLVQVIHR